MNIIWRRTRKMRRGITGSTWHFVGIKAHILQQILKYKVCTLVA